MSRRGAPKKLPVVAVTAGCVLLVGIPLVAWAMSTLENPTETIETDGHRELQYRVFTVIPARTVTEKDPSLNITELVSSRISSEILLPSSISIKSIHGAMHDIQPGKEVFSAHFPANGAPGTLAKQIQAALMGATITNGPRMLMVQSSTATGARIQFTLTPAKGGGNDCQVDLIEPN